MRKILAYIAVPCSDVYIKVPEGFRPFGSAFFDHECGYAVQPMIQYEPEMTAEEALDLVRKNRVSFEEKDDEQCLAATKPSTVDFVQNAFDGPKEPGPYDGRPSAWNADGPGPYPEDLFIPNVYEARSSDAFTAEPIHRVFKNGDPILGTYVSKTQAIRAAIELNEAYKEGVDHGRAFQGALGDVYDNPGQPGGGSS